MDATAMLVPSSAWRSAFPDAVVGALVMRGVRNVKQSAALEADTRRLEQKLRATAGGAERASAEADRVARATSTITELAARPTR
jgi:hypothetical protein